MSLPDAFVDSCYCQAETPGSTSISASASRYGGFFNMPLWAGPSRSACSKSAQSLVVGAVVIGPGLADSAVAVTAAAFAESAGSAVEKPAVTRFELNSAGTSAPSTSRGDLSTTSAVELPRKSNRQLKSLWYLRNLKNSRLILAVSVQQLNRQ